MKSSIQVISIKSKKFVEFENLTSLYKTKILNFTNIKFDEIKAFEGDRDQKDVKVNKESDLILDKIDSHSYVILCDETGEYLNNQVFADIISEKLEVIKKITFVVGGAFGVNGTVKKKADLRISLSPFVLNHLMAKAVLLEQIYRTFTIINKIPYHND